MNWDRGKKFNEGAKSCTVQYMVWKVLCRRADTDILLGKNCGLQTLLVGSGVHNMDKVAMYSPLSAGFFSPTVPGSRVLFPVLRIRIIVTDQDTQLHGIS